MGKHQTNRTVDESSRVRFSRTAGLTLHDRVRNMTVCKVSPNKANVKLWAAFGDDICISKDWALIFFLGASKSPQGDTACTGRLLQQFKLVRPMELSRKISNPWLGCLPCSLLNSASQKGSIKGTMNDNYFHGVPCRFSKDINITMSPDTVFHILVYPMCIFMRQS